MLVFVTQEEKEIREKEQELVWVLNYVHVVKLMSTVII